MPQKIGILLFLAILLSGPAHTQQYNFRRFAHEEGLPNSTAFRVAQDSNYYLWTGTDGGGAGKFDGHTFKMFSTENGLPGDIVREIFCDSRGYVWIGTDNGLVYNDGYKWIPVSTKEEYKGSAVLRIIEDHQGNIWAATNDSGINVIRFDTEVIEIRNINSEHGLVSNFVFDIYEDRLNRIWLGLIGGIDMMKMNGSEIEIIHIDNYFDAPGNIITCIEEYEDGLWFGTYHNGPFRLDNIYTGFSNYKISIPEYQELSTARVWDILLDSHERLWFATDSRGVICKRDNNFEVLDAERGLPGNQILDIFEDHEGNIWFGSMGSGLFMFQGFHLLHYGENEGIESFPVYALTCDDKNNIWIGCADGGIRYLKNYEKNNQFELFTQIMGSTISAMIFRDNGELWVGTNELGVLVYNGKLKKKYDGIDFLPSNNINCIAFGWDNIPIIGTNNGFARIEDERIFIVNENNGLLNNEVQTLLHDRSGYTWIGTLGGLAKLDQNNYRDFDRSDGLNDLRINALEEDKNGEIIIGTMSGIFKTTTINDSVSIEKWISNAHLISENISGLKFLDNGQLIVATDQGFTRISFNETTYEIYETNHYDKSKGFTGIETLPNAIIQTNKSDLWLATIRGVSRYLPAEEINNTIKPVVRLESIKLFYKNVDWGERFEDVTPWNNLPKRLNLPHGDNNLTFSYTAINFSNPAHLVYQYKLEGMDPDWSPPTRKNEVTYPGIKHGYYTLKIRASIDQKNWSEILEFPVVITPPYWQTIWFYIFVVGLATLLIVLFIQYRERQLINEKRRLEEVVSERTKMIVKQKNEIEINRDKIQQQHDLVESQKLSITKSIEYARKIQSALLPDPESFNRHFLESFIFYLPRDIVSGDFFWMSRRGHEVIVIAADCSGHGVPGAFMSMLGVAFLNEIVNKEGITQPNEILDELREMIIESLNQHINDFEGSKDGMDMSVINYNEKTRKMIFAGAMNPMYIVRNDQIIELKGDKMPVSIFDTMSPFQNHVMQLMEADRVYMFSDGYIDQFGGPKNKKYLSKRFKSTLLNIHKEPMPKQHIYLMNNFLEWKGENEQVDDILVIGFKV